MPSPDTALSDTNTIPGLTNLGNNIFFHDPTLTPTPQTPEPQHRTSDNGHPSLIILCTWLGGATPRRIAKYVNLYRQTLFPHSAILVITTTIPDLSYRSFRSLRARLAPARAAIVKTLSRPDTSNSDDEQQKQLHGAVLLHIFSNGGANTAIQLILSLREEHGLHLPLRRMVLDCSPGAGTFTKIYHAGSYSIPPGAVRQLLGRAALYPFVGAITSLQALGLMASVEDLRRQLNDPGVFSTGVRRLYLYSDGDQVVERGDVEEHAEAARRRGFGVEMGFLEGKGHCALILGDEEGRYGRVIGEFWDGEREGKGERKGANAKEEGGEEAGLDTSARLVSKL